MSTAPRCRSSSGNADDGVAGGFEDLLFQRVLAEGSRAAVAGAVDLDGELVLGPVEVGLDAVDVRVHERLGEPVEQ